jgi:hypothetical protein
VKRLKTVKSSVIALITIGAIWTAWQFTPPPPSPSLPSNYRADKAVWLGVTWVMDAHTDEEIVALARDLKSHSIDYVFAYVSYLKPGDVFNPTFEHARDFVRRFREEAPQITLLAWIGVPMQITPSDGQYIANRLTNPPIREIIAEFSARTVMEFGFDGVHLNAEAIPDGDTAYIATLQAIESALPSEAYLSVAVHALP